MTSSLLNACSLARSTWTMVTRELDRWEPSSPTDHCTRISTISHVNIGWKTIVRGLASLISNDALDIESNSDFVLQSGWQEPRAHTCHFLSILMMPESCRQDQ